jgi:IPT/TIG domain
MRRVLTICLFALAAVLVAAPAALAAGGPAPTITRVQPMRVSVGNLLTISGKNFKAQRTRNTVIFRGPTGRTAFAKPRRATRRKLVVRVPAAVARLLRVSGSRQRPTRLKLRVLSGQFSKFTPRRLSPVVTGVGDGDGGPGGGGGGGGGTVVCDNSADHDGDLLLNTLELAIGTDPCLADTDNDQMSDGWEYWSAKDLNIKAVPFPGERPFPNALDPSDGAPAPARFSNIDFDGDGLTTLEEYRAWRLTGSAFDASKGGGLDLESTLGYSDGTKYSRASETPGVPGWRSPSFGLAAPTQAFPATYDLWDDGPWHDDERDADGDGLSNWLESAGGPGRPSYWAGYWKVPGRQIDPWAKKSYCAPPEGPQAPGVFDSRPFGELDMADPDVDGDTVLDGEDDQDNDDYSNITELYEVVYDLDQNGVPPAPGERPVNPAWCGGHAPGVIPSIDRGGVAWAINPFNPCAPSTDARTCPDYIPFED